MQVTKILKRFLLLLVLFLAAFSIQLREAKTDYYLAIVFSGLSLLTFFLIKNKKLSLYDIGWGTSLLFSVIYIYNAYLQGYNLQIILMQSLVFLMPMISLMSRKVKLDVSNENVTKLLMYLVTIKLIVFLLHYPDVIRALTSRSERARFHDYTSIALVLTILPMLLYGFVESNTKRIFLTVSMLIFVATAAHRSLYIALIIQLLVWLLSYRGISVTRKMFFFVNLSIVTVLILFFSNFGNVMVDLFGASVRGDDGNTNFRMELYLMVLTNWYEHFFGLGFGLPYIYGTNSSGEPVYYALHHNSYLTYLYFIGFLPMLVFIGSTLHFFLRVNKDREPEFYKNILLGMSVFAIFNLFFEHPLFAIPYWLIFGLYLKSLEFSSR